MLLNDVKIIRNYDLCQFSPHLNMIIVYNIIYSKKISRFRADMIKGHFSKLIYGQFLLRHDDVLMRCWMITYCGQCK